MITKREKEIRRHNKEMKMLDKERDNVIKTINKYVKRKSKSYPTIFTIAMYSKKIMSREEISKYLKISISQINKTMVCRDLSKKIKPHDMDNFKEIVYALNLKVINKER